MSIKGQQNIHSVLTWFFLGAFLIPCILFTAIVLKSTNEEQVLKRQMFSSLLREDFENVLSTELDYYRHLARIYCDSGTSDPGELKTSPLILCGTAGSGALPKINYLKYRGHDYLSPEALRGSTWWPKLLSSQGPWVQMRASTSVAAPYFRTFVVIADRSPTSGATIFALFDSLPLTNTLSKRASAFSKLGEDVPILLNSEGQVLFSPAEELGMMEHFKSPGALASAASIHIGNARYTLERLRPIQPFPGSQLQLVLARPDSPHSLSHWRAMTLLVYSVGLICILGAIAALILTQKIAQPVSQISEFLKDFTNRLQGMNGALPTAPSLEAGTSEIGELRDLTRGINTMFAALYERDRRLLSLNRALIEKEALAKVGEVSSQVAHDIRSPLAALEMASAHLGESSEETRVIIRSAVSRIRDIANQLLLKFRLPGSGSAGRNEPTCLLLSSLIDSLVSEKRMQFKARPEVEIDFCMHPASYGLFARVQAGDLNRVLSNLINNGMEAITGEGRVQVDLKPAGKDQVEITVEDNGHGIPEKILAELSKRGATYGKEDGTGLGLFHAKSTIERWGGSLEISSEIGGGARARILLPKAEAPLWFVPALEVARGACIVVLDDDASIHQIWQGRFASTGLEVLHFSTSGELSEWWHAIGAFAKDALFLVDYELLDQDCNGLELVEKLGIQAKSILVTSRYEEHSVFSKCQALGMRMIPKGIAGFVPIIALGTPQVDARDQSRIWQNPV